MSNISINNLILQSVDKDISDLFSALDDGSYMPLLPINIHIARHLAIISDKLSVDRNSDSGDCSNRCSKG